MLRQVIILAGGFGTRLQRISKGTPKALLPIGNSVYLDLLIEKVVQYNISHIYLSLYYKPELFQNYINNSNHRKIITSIVEPEPLGTGGAISYVINNSEIPSSFFVINGDTLSDINLELMYSSFKKSNFKAMLGSSSVLDTSRYGNIVEKNDKIVSFEEKGFRRNGFINNGHYIFRKEVFDNYYGQFSLEDDLFPELVKNKELGVYKINNDNFIDMGVPKDYKKLCKLFEASK